MVGGIQNIDFSAIIRTCRDIVSNREKLQLAENDENRLLRLASCLESAKFDLKFFYYQGTSMNRPEAKFCNDRIGKIFSINEARIWDRPANSNDRLNIFLDLGNECQEGYCNHTLGFISTEIALLLRPNLELKDHLDGFNVDELECMLNFFEETITKYQI